MDGKIFRKFFCKKLELKTIRVNKSTFAHLRSVRYQITRFHFFQIVVILVLFCSLLLASSGLVYSAGSGDESGHPIQVVAATASPQWTGEFEYTVVNPAPAGKAVITGSGTFSFNITEVSPVNFSLSGTGRGHQSIAVQGQCSGGGSTAYTFKVFGEYDRITNQFNLGVSRATPDTYKVPLSCGPRVDDQGVGYGFFPTGAVIAARDGATVACPGGSDCDPRLTYMVTIHGSSFCTSSGGEKLIFYIQRDTFPTGHAFMQFETTAGPQNYRTDLVYGHGSISGPFNDGFTRGPGAPQHGLLEADHPWDWRIVYHVNSCQYDAAAHFVNSEIANPSVYSLTSFNCVDWIDAAASAAGLQLPEGKNFLGISDPVTFADSLAAIGDGGSFNGGVVQKNTQGLSPRNLFDPPSPNETLASPLDLIKYALDNASALAASQNMSSQVIALSPVTLAPSGNLTLSFNGNYVTNYSLAVVDWGDGTPRVPTTALQLSHVLKSSSSVKVAVFSFGTFATFLLNVTLNPGAAGTATIPASIPSPNASSTTMTTSSAGPPLAENISEIAAGSNQTTAITSGSSAVTTSSSGVSNAASSSAATAESASSNFSSATAISFSLYIGVVLFVVIVIFAIGAVRLSQLRTRNRRAPRR